MMGEPQDVDGECNAHLVIADNYGDGHATMRCELPPDHDGLHKEEYERKGGTVTVTWSVDDRARCDHGCGQWKHAHNDKSIRCPKDAEGHERSDCAFCHPGKEAKTCEECGRPYYYERGHKRHCPGQPFACLDCGENGHGVHACPRSTEISGSVGDDEFGRDP